MKAKDLITRMNEQLKAYDTSIQICLGTGDGYIEFYTITGFSDVGGTIIIHTDHTQLADSTKQVNNR